MRMTSEFGRKFELLQAWFQAFYVPRLNEVLNDLHLIPIKTGGPHIFHARVNKFFCWNEVPWYQGLLIIAYTTIAYGLFLTLAFMVITLLCSPAKIRGYFLFPTLVLHLFLLCFTYIALGILLWTAVVRGNLKHIKLYPWGLLFVYFLMCFILFEFFVHSEGIIHGIVWTEYGMSVKSTPEKEEALLNIQRCVFYPILCFLLISILAFTTYFIILTLSTIESLEYDIEFNYLTK